MTPDPHDRFTLEKLKVNERLESIEAYIKEGKELRQDINETLTQINVRCTNMEMLIHGDPKSPLKYERDGMNRRLEDVEKSEEAAKKEASKVKDNFLNVAVGSIVLAIGAFFIWLFKLIWSSIGK